MLASIKYLKSWSPPSLNENLEIKIRSAIKDFGIRETADILVPFPQKLIKESCISGAISLLLTLVLGFLTDNNSYDKNSILQIMLLVCALFTLAMLVQVVFAFTQYGDNHTKATKWLKDLASHPKS